MKKNRELLEIMFKIVGTKAAVQLLEDKAVLHVWRNSSPHNYWIAPINKEYNMIWHSKDLRESLKMSDGSFIQTRVPPMMLFKNISNEGIVSYGRSILKLGDEGKSMKSVYKLDPGTKAIWKRMTDKMKREIKNKYK